MKKSYYCEKLQKTLHFLPDGVKYCCSCAEGVGLKISDFENFNEQYVINKRNEYIELLKEGIIPDQCNGCVEYKERKITDKIKSAFCPPKKSLVSHIIADHYKQCDCDCIYCSQKKLFPEQIQKYKLLPVIKKLYENHLIDTKNLKVEFQGGNISVLTEFDSLMREFRANDCHSYLFLTNFIKYMPQLENLDWRSLVCVSLDSGCKETFEKIKKVDAFDDVVNNLKRLRSTSQIEIQMKYILLSGINDNLEELSRFLPLAKSIDPKGTIILEFDYNDTIMNPDGANYKVPEHYYELFDFAQEYCSGYGMRFFMLPHTKALLDKCRCIN